MRFTNQTIRYTRTILLLTAMCLGRAAIAEEVSQTDTNAAIARAKEQIAAAKIAQEDTLRGFPQPQVSHVDSTEKIRRNLSAEVQTTRWQQQVRPADPLPPECKRSPTPALPAIIQHWHYLKDAEPAATKSAH